MATATATATVTANAAPVADPAKTATASRTVTASAPGVSVTATATVTAVSGHYMVQQRAGDTLVPARMGRREGSGITWLSPALPAGQSVPAVTKLAPGRFTSGANLSGPELSQSAAVGTGYPSTSYVDWLLARGVRVLRLPFRWNAMQPTLDAALDGTELGHHVRIADRCLAAGAVLIPDLHDFGGRGGTAAANKIGALGAVTSAPTGPTIGQFADFWRRYAAAMGAHRAVFAYGLMHDPQNMPAGSFADGRAAWYAAAQAAVNAVAAVDTATRVAVSAYGSSALGAWVTASGVRDDNVVTHPRGQEMFLWDAHFYFDGAGTYAQSYATALAGVAQQTTTDPAGGPAFDDALVKTRVLELRAWLAWLATNQADGFVGEWGIPRDDAGSTNADAAKWAAIADRMMVEVKNWLTANPGRRVLLAQWAAGTAPDAGYSLRYGPNDTTQQPYLPGLVVERNL